MERHFVISEGRISKNGIPIIEVVADGCYSKITYKKNYSVLSNATAIIGKRTDKILYLGIRNKYCYSCDRATVKHTNFKNDCGPSLV